MAVDLSAQELLTTTRAVRKRLDLTRPVPRELINECLEVALQAPTGSNRQPWHFVVVDDPEKRAALAELYGRSFDAYAATPGSTYKEGDPRAERQPLVRDSATYLRQHLHEVPVHVVPCSWGRLGEQENAAVHQASYWGSILPAVWSFMLAARMRGLGTAWTTLHLAFEREAAEVLGIPFEKVTQAGLVPVAFTKGTSFKPASRLPIEQVTHWNTWGAS